MKKHLLFLFAALLPLVASAQTKVEIKGIWYKLTSETKQAEVTFKGSRYDSYSNEYSGSITIPATVTYEGVDYSVTSIGKSAFYCSSLTSITIPESVTKIGRFAFKGCHSLASIVVASGNTVYDSRNGCNAIIETSSNTLIQGSSSTIVPESVTSIGANAFNGCSCLDSIVIPESVIEIGISAFSDCDSLTSIIVAAGNTVYDSRNGCNAIIETSSNTLIQGCSSTVIPQGVKTIEIFAFSDCSSLTSIVIPEGVTVIGNWAFSGCDSLTSIIISESVTSIGEAQSAFAGCKSLTSIIIPESVTEIGSWTFMDCDNLTSIVVAAENTVYDSRNGCNAIIETSSNTLIQGCSSTIIPQNVTEIGDGAFYGCDSLISIVIPESVTSIGANAFNGCSCLDSIVIPESVIEIGEYAFYDCESLTSIVIPKGVKSIGRWAFAGCCSLTSITCHAVTPPAINYGTFDEVDKSTPVYVPAGSVEVYKEAYDWKEFRNIVAISH